MCNFSAHKPLTILGTDHKIFVLLQMDSLYQNNKEVVHFNAVRISLITDLGVEPCVRSPTCACEFSHFHASLIATRDCINIGEMTRTRRTADDNTGCGVSSVACVSVVAPPQQDQHQLAAKPLTLPNAYRQHSQPHLNAVKMWNSANSHLMVMGKLIVSQLLKCGL